MMLKKKHAFSIIGKNKDSAIGKEFEDIISSMSEDECRVAETIEEFDEITFRHSVGVAYLTLAQMKTDASFTPEDRRNWTVAALLHDMGKVEINPRILNKPGKLNNEELEEMDTHSLKSKKIYERYSLSREARIASLGHHIPEKFLQNDWHGISQSKNTWQKYGEKLDDLFKREIGALTKKEKKALAMVSLADKTEAMRCDYRPYKKAMDWNVIKKYMSNDVSLGNLHKDSFEVLCFSGYRSVADNKKENERNFVKTRKAVLEKYASYFQSRGVDVEFR